MGGVENIKDYQRISQAAHTKHHPAASTQLEGMLVRCACLCASAIVNRDDDDFLGGRDSRGKHHSHVPTYIQYDTVRHQIASYRIAHRHHQQQSHRAHNYFRS